MMTRAERYTNLAVFLGMILVNVLASTLPLNGVTTAEISDRYPVLFTPAGYVFAIWGPIYLLLGGFVVYQFLRPHDPQLSHYRYLFAVSSVLNSVWIFAWHWEMIRLSVVIMLGLLVTLCVIYTRLGKATGVIGFPTWLAQRLPFSVYLGWISVATIANVSVALWAWGWNGWGLDPVSWTMVMVSVAAVLGAVTLFLRSDLAFVLVIIWALVGVSVNSADTSSLRILTLGLAVGLAILSGLRLAIWRAPADPLSTSP